MEKSSDDLSVQRICLSSSEKTAIDNRKNLAKTCHKHLSICFGVRLDVLAKERAWLLSVLVFQYYAAAACANVSVERVISLILF